MLNCHISVAQKQQEPLKQNKNYLQARVHLFISCLQRLTM